MLFLEPSSTESPVEMEKPQEYEDCSHLPKAGSEQRARGWSQEGIGGVCSCEALGWFGITGQGRELFPHPDLVLTAYVHFFGSLDLPLIKPKGLQSNFEISQAGSVSGKCF